MSQQDTAFWARYMMGSQAFDEVFDNGLSGSEREDKLSSAAHYFGEALKFAPDLDMQQECHRRLGVTLLYLHFHDPVDIANSGLLSLPNLNGAIEELELSLALDTKLEEKTFTNRSVAAVVLLPLDTIWMYQSMFLEKQAGVREAIDFLESKLKLLDYLGGVNLPGVCFILHMHYMTYLQSNRDNIIAFHRAENLLKRAANGEAYADVASVRGTVFSNASQHYKKQAQQALAEW